MEQINERRKEESPLYLLMPEREFTMQEPEQLPSSTNLSLH
jgi:hypothetical protein